MEQIQRYKKEIGIAVIVIIFLSIISSFSSGSKKDEPQEESTASTGDEPQEESTASTGGKQVASTASMGGKQVASMGREDVERAVVEAKFMNKITDPSTQVEIRQMASKLSFNNLDINEDNRISTDEIPDGDLKDELFGYDLDEDGVIVLEEYEKYFENRQSKRKGGTVTGTGLGFKLDPNSL
jgi:hypothetical protein